MFITDLFTQPVKESAYGQQAGVDVFKQLIQAFKDKKQIDLKVGPEQFPVRYDEARYLLSIWKASGNKGKTAELFGNVNWIQSQLEQRDYKMSPDRLNDLDQERAKEIDKEKVLNLEAKCPVTGEDECHCGDPKKVDEAEFEITYKNPQFTGTKTHTVNAVNAKGAEQKFLSFGNPYKVLDVKKKEKVVEADRPLPKDFIPEPVVTQTIKDLGPGLDPMANGFYDLAYGKLLSNYLAQNTPEIKKKFNVNWNLAWASQMRELYSREYGGYMKTPAKESVKEYKLEPRDKEDKLEKLKTLNQLLVDPNTSKDPELKKAIQKRISQLKEDPTPKRRVMDFDNHSLYWGGAGKYQDQYSKLYDKLVPNEGKADTVEGELLRAVGRIIYRHGNDGDHFSHGSYEWIEKHVGKFDHLDDMADKVIQYILSKKGDYTPNNFDWLTVADYGPGEYEKDWEQVSCNNCDGSGEIVYDNDDGEEDYEECDSCDGNGWIEQTSESKKIDEILPALAGLAGRAIAGVAGGIGKAVVGGIAGGLASSAIKKKFEEDYKGWKYGEEIDQYDDVTKKFHYAEKNGKKVDMDWSPYSTPTEEDFRLWVDLGMPTRKAVKGIAPLNIDDLIQLAKDDPNVTHSLLTREDKEEDSIDTKKLDAKTKVALKKAGLKYGAQTKGDPLASLVTFVADKDSEKTQDISRLDKENDEEERDIAFQGTVDKKHDTAIGQNSLKDRYQDQEIEKLKQDLQKLLSR